jgi:putative ABC transport system substrate-binding protein
MKRFWNLGFLFRPTGACLSFFAFCTLLVIISLPAQAQQDKKSPRIGILLSGSRNPIWGEAFRNALAELGYIEGQNIRIEYRNAGGDSRRQIQLAKELVALQPDIHCERWQ